MRHVTPCFGMLCPDLSKVDAVRIHPFASPRFQKFTTLEVLTSVNCFLGDTIHKSKGAAPAGESIHNSLQALVLSP